MSNAHDVAHAPKHPYHLVEPSRWPIIGAIAAGLTTVGAVMFMHGGWPWLLPIGFILILYTMFGWFRDVVREATFQHLHTPISGTLRNGHNILALVEQLHPSPAVGGFPIDAARAFIREREALDRGWYAGPIGWIDRNGEGEFAVAIRSALMRRNDATLFAGCGIMGDSNPDEEYEESCLKLQSMLANLGGTAE